MEKKHIFFTVIVLLSIIINFGQTSHVPKTFNKPVLMHYMPWFETPEYNGKWGWHWTMNNQNPDIIVDMESSKRQIASHYYPLIGPYSSIDEDVIEYHLLLMKYAGVDCVAIDWYGIKGSNGDINSLLTNSNAIINRTQSIGLNFSIILEDRYSRNLEDIQDNLDYASKNYFNKSNYLRYGQQNQPVVGIFGPITFENESDWDAIMPFAGEELTFLTLWNESSDAGVYASGEYAWVFEIDENDDHLTYLNEFYSESAPLLNTVMGSTYPGFKDFYSEGGAGDGFFTVDHNGNITLTETLQLISQYSPDIDLLQLVTWNDFGEGTMFEPTLEFGFSFLTTMQKYLGVSYGLEELQQIHRLYQLRKLYALDLDIQETLDIVFNNFVELNPTQAKIIMDNIEGGSLSLNEKAKINFKVYPSPFKDELNINLDTSFSNREPLTVCIYNFNGQLLINELFFLKENNTIELKNLQKLASGLYIVQLKTNSSILRIKILKK